MERLDAQCELALDRVRAEVRDALSALDAAQRRVALVRREVEVTAQLEAAERQRFEAGDSTLFVVNLREQATAEARVREVDALLDWQRASASFRAATAEDVGPIVNRGRVSDARPGEDL
jgi:outer membrane protein TolC